MNKSIICCVLLISFPAISQSEVTGNVTLTTDYVWRGVSQSFEDPAIQGGFDWAHSSGFAVGVWGSNVDFVDGALPDDGADMEFDIYASWSQELNEDWLLNLGAIRYIYPSTASAIDYDWNEFSLGAGYKEWLSFTVNYSTDALASSETAIFYEIATEYELAKDWGLSTSLGFYDLDDLEKEGAAAEENYSYIALHLSRGWGKFTATLSGFATDSNAEDIYNDNGDSRVVFSITGEF